MSSTARAAPICIACNGSADDDIGALPVEWNWLEGWNEKPAQGTPKVVHFTRGGPWFEHWQNVDYGELWCAERDDDAAPAAL